MIAIAAPRAGADWRAILLLLYNILAMLFMLLAAVLTGLSGLMNMFAENNPQHVAEWVLAGGLIFCALLLTPGIYFSARRVLGMDEVRALPARLTARDWLIFLFGWPAILLISEWLLQQPYGWIIAPVFTAVSVLLPVWFLIKFGARSLPAESRLRSWGVFSAGIGFTPVIVLIFEGIALIALLIVIVSLLSLQPGALDALQHLATQFDRARTEEQYFTLLSPYLTSPYVVIGLLFVFSVVAPIVEESLKTGLLWLIGRRVTGPAEGFVLGLLCGAGFTIIETIGSSSNGLEAWSASMLTRFGSDLIHIVNGGLMGWAIVSALQERRYGRLIATFVAVMFIHGLWNACTIFITLGALYLEIPDAPTWSFNAITGGSGGLLTLAIGNMIILALCNRRLRAIRPPPAASDFPAAVTVIESTSTLD